MVYASPTPTPVETELRPFVRNEILDAGLKMSKEESLLDLFRITFRARDMEGVSPVGIHKTIEKPKKRVMPKFGKPALAEW